MNVFYSNKIHEQSKRVRKGKLSVSVRRETHIPLQENTCNLRVNWVYMAKVPVQGIEKNGGNDGENEADAIKQHSPTFCYAKLDLQSRMLREYHQHPVDPALGQKIFDNF